MSEWPETTLGSCVELTKGVTYTAADYAEKGQGHPFLTIKCVKKGGGYKEEGLKYYKGPFKNEQVVKLGSLLMALTDLTRGGDIIGSPFRVPELGESVVLPSMDLAALKVLDQTTNLSFLAYRLMLEDAHRYMLARSAGTTVLHLDSISALKFRFQRPDLRTQKHISEILSTVDEAIEQTEALIAKTQQIKAGLMHDLFTRGVTPDGQLRPPREEAPQLYKESSLGWIPKEWEAEKLGDILERYGGYLQTGPFGSQLHAHEYQTEGVPVVMPQDIERGLITTSQIARIAENRAQVLGRHRMKAGDIVIARRGDLSRAAAISDSELGWVCGTGCFLLRLGHSALMTEFASYCYRQDFVQRQIAARAVGTTMPSLNNAVMAQLRFPFCDEDEQFRTIERVQSVENEQLAHHVSLNAYRSVKAGLMGDLLSNRVHVSIAASEPEYEVVTNG